MTKSGNSGVKKALDGIDLDIGEGEIVGIIGKNGAGKSTLMKLASEITYPTEGSIDVCGHSRFPYQFKRRIYR